jgi:uncharacterized protein (TIGR03067 family)
MRNAILVVLLALPVGWFAFGQPQKAELPATGSLNSEQIGRLLKDMGYDSQELTPDVFQVTVNREGWKVHVMVSLARDNERVWLESKFAPIADPDLVPASAWRKLLEENERIGPAHFTFDKSDKRVHLYKAFDNVGLSPARLKKEIDGFDAVVRRTQSVWRAENFTAAEALPVMPRTTDPAAQEAASLRGSWRIVRIEAKGESITEDRLAKFKPALVLGPETAVLRMGVEPERTVKVTLDPAAKPKRIDFTDDRGRLEQGIYTLDGGLLTVCVAGAGEERPRQFITEPGSKTWLLVLKREE